MENKNNTEDGIRVVNHNEMHNCNVFQGDTYGGIFPLPGAQVTINQYLDPRKMKTGEGQQALGKVEPKEERDERKRSVMEDIIGRFNFTDEQLARDRRGNRISNERLGIAFAQVFGLRGAHPGTSAMSLTEQLWTLLIDERNQCAKRAGEGFIRQTVLNIVGYFAKRGIVSGQPRDVARSVFPDTDTNEARNISREISSNVFPEGTANHIDFYLNKLQNGEI